jgi:Flp pilus assembly pilin Flp
MNTITELMKEFIKEEDGIAIVEIILILVLLVGLVLLFRQSITDFVKGVIESIANNMDDITSE